MNEFNLRRCSLFFLHTKRAIAQKSKDLILATAPYIKIMVGCRTKPDKIRF